MPKTLQVEPTQTRPSGIPLSLKHLHRTHDTGVAVLEDFSLDVPAGQFVAILGPSGCGKSTLLRIIAGLDAPQAGKVAVGLSTASRTSSAEIAYVFQDAHLLPWRTVIRNVELPLELVGLPKSLRRERAALALARVGLSDTVDRYPAQLSGGMRMRVSLARALVSKPNLLLLDEPFAALDEITRQQLDEQLLELWQAEGMTVVFVTHSTAEAGFLAERAVVLSRRPGRIVEDRMIELPRVRMLSTRGAPEFARETSVLFEALKRGGA